MLNIFKRKEWDYNVYAPVDGQLITLESVNDGVFSEKMLGDGCAFSITDGMICAPITGTVTAVFPSKHAIGITADSGLEVLVHVGLETVAMNGKPFLQYVMEGQKVKAGKPVLFADMKMIVENGSAPLVIMVVTNSKSFEIIERSELKTVATGEKVFAVRLKR
ncbi:MAG: PTS glucose transporter subunit IIA [Erysipelotrichaceae bacterium]|nr:PTS glucose transporter subunit IIA [Erysipelotrichaceae bacterium]